MKRIIGFCLFVISSIGVFAQESAESAEEMGLDERINKWFEPIADTMLNYVLYAFSFIED